MQAAAERGIAGGSHPLPYVDAIQPLFGGHDLGAIQAHTDGHAAAGARDMGAAAFAAGNHVAFAGTPDVHTAAHEAAHVVQQRAGVQLKSGVGEAGDAYERNADAVADRVVQGRSAADLLPPPQAGGTGGAEPGVQRQSGDPEMSAAAVQAALAWARTSGLGVEAIQEVQRYCGMTGTQVDGIYNEQTARAVFRKERDLRLGQDGKADADFFFHAGLIFTNEITPAVVSDDLLTAVQQQFANGITVAIYADYVRKTRNNLEFVEQANNFAANEHVVGLSGGQVALGVPCPIREIGDVIEVVQSIHRGLVQRWTTAQGGDAARAPSYTRVLNLALFSHGEPWGMALNENEWISGGGLHGDVDPFNGYPSNIEAFVRGIHSAVMPGVRVELFGCSAARGDDSDGNPRSEYQEWSPGQPLPQGDVAGFGSFASELSGALGDQATVLAPGTGGHTTENYAARVFGAEATAAGVEAGGGLSYFDVMYPEAYVQDQVDGLGRFVSGLDVAALDRAQRAALHDEVRRVMWDQFRDSVVGEQARVETGETRRYAQRTGIPTFAMGQEMFLHPDAARVLLHADWEEYWLPLHVREIQLP
ncbi:MAG TPA: DUF4157 domain-containing protein [Kofleriaceae bacterium]